MKLDRYDISGRTALITGASGLLGFEHCIALLDIGADLVLTDINEEHLKKSQKKLQDHKKEANIHSFVMDVTDKVQVEEVNKSLKKQGIRLDILINNAALNPKVDKDDSLKESSRLESFSLDQWNLELAVGLTGSFICSQVFGSEMAKNNSGGVILNIASDLSIISPDQRLYRAENCPEDSQPVKPITYSAIKSGLIGLTLYLSTYWADKNIRCNALSPGGVYDNQSDEFVRRIESLVPMGRMASVDEYRSTVQYLCSDASSYLNGQNIVVDGGRSVL